MAKEASKAVPLDITRAQFPTDFGLYSDDRTPQSVYKVLVEQIRAEWEYAYRTQNAKTQKYLNRLRLYNNQKRDDDVVGDNTLFTIHNSILSSLYSDEMTVEFTGRNEGNEDIASNLNATALYDREEMKKAKLDYFWDWDTLFFGKGFIFLSGFDRKRMCPMPTLIDPTTWMQDPEAESLNGDMFGNGAARFCGHEILQTKYQMENIPGVFDLDMVKMSKSTRSLIDQARQSRQDAQGLNQQIRTEEKDLGMNAYYQVVEWFTHYQDDYLTGGKLRKVLVWLANDRSKVIRFKILPQDDRWPVIERSLFPSSHDFYGTSVTDLVEDKQRMKAILLNLGVNLLKSDLFGMYLYDRNLIKSRADLNFDFNKFVGVDLERGQSLQNVIQPMARQSGNIQYFNLIMQILDSSAQKATATPDLQQGQIAAQDRTLGELALVNNKLANRYSLATEIFGWSEKSFWEQWYYLYKKYFKGTIDEKTIRLQGIFAPKYKNITRDMIIGKSDPDVTITSKFVSETARNRNRQLMNEYAQILLQSKDTNVRYLLKKLGRYHGLNDEELTQMLPPTPDERKALEENVTLNENKDAPVSPDDEHEQHLEQHNKAKKTEAALAHVMTHMRALELQKTRPDLFPKLAAQQAGKQQAQQNTADQIQQIMKKRNPPVAAPQGEMGGVVAQ